MVEIKAKTCKGIRPSTCRKYSLLINIIPYNYNALLIIQKWVQINNYK